MVLALTCAGCASCGAPPEDASDGALVLLLPQEPLEIDPRHVGDAQGLRVSRLLFAGLVAIDPLALEAVPDLAERVDVEDAGLTYRVHLRAGLRFSDGSPLGVEDVLATYRSVVDPQVGSRYAETYRRAIAIESPDARTVVFRLAEAHAPFMTDLELPIVRAADARAHLSLDSDSVVGAGPYRLAGRVGRSVSLEANAHYHRGPVAHPRVRMVVVRDDNTRALRMLAGAGDLAIGSIPPLLVPMFEDDARFEVRRAPGIGTAYVGVNLEAPLLADVRVRRAIAHAIDREALVRSELGGRGSVAQGWIPAGHWAYEADVARYAFDPTRARALLDEAGLVDPDGEGPEPRARVAMRCASDRTRVSAARAIAAMLRDVGLEVEVRPQETASLLADLGRGRFQLAFMAVPEVIEPHVLEWFFASSRIPAEGRAGGANRWRFRDAAFDAALARGRVLTARAERRAAYAEAQRRMAELLPVIPLWHEDVVAVSTARASDVPVPRDARYGVLALRTQGP